jgi:hypothetical protein
MIPNHASSFFPCFLLLAPLAAQDAIQLQSPTTGKVAFVQRAKQAQNIDAGGQQMEANQELTHHYTVEVTKVAEDGKRTFTVTIDRVNGSIDVPMAGTIAFDSASKETESEGEGDDGAMGGMGMPSGATMTAGLKEIAGKQFTATVGADGTIHGTAGFDEARKAAEKKLGMAGQFLNSAMSERSLQNLVRGAIGHLPTAAVAPGATWETKIEAGTGITTEQSLKLTLVKADADAAEISYSGSVAKKEGGGRGPMADATVENGKVSGVAIISRKDGFAMSLKSTSSMTLLTENEMVGEMSIEMKLSTEVMRADDAAKTEAAKTALPAKSEPAKPATGK